jgi:large subunit ribosomal protein L32
MQPVHKKSKMRKRTRRSHHAKTPIALIACPQCGRARVPHTACGQCGHVTSTLQIKIGSNAE